MANDERLKALEDKVAELSGRLDAVEDTNAIRSLHFIYGYYIDMCLYDEAVDLFAEDGAVRFLNGLYQRKSGVQRLYCDWFRKTFTKGHNGPVFGFLLDHLMLQDVITIAPDHKTAKMRVRALNMIGYHDKKPEPLEHMPQQFWGGGIYENVYVKEGRVWRIKLLDYIGRWQAPYEQGWAHSSGHLPPFEKTFPENPIGPDQILADMPYGWPETSVVPFHYSHPVTGKSWSPPG
jgi:SnoaL-like domain